MATIPQNAKSLTTNAATWIEWTPLTFTGADDGEAVGPFPGADRSIQVTGTFGAGGTLVWEGTNAEVPGGATWATLNDPQGNPLSFTSARIEQISEYTRWMRPRVTAGDGTTSLTVRMLVARG